MFIDIIDVSHDFICTPVFLCFSLRPCYRARAPEDLQPGLRLHRGIHAAVTPQALRDGSQAWPHGEFQI